MRGVTLLVLMAGCGGAVDEKAFPKEAAKVLCAQYAQCAAGYLEAEFSTKSDCLTVVEEEVEEVTLTFGSLGCEWDDTLAGECLQETKKLDCAGFYNAEMVPEEGSFTRGFITVPLETCSALIDPCLGDGTE